MIQCDIENGTLTINALPFWRGIQDAPVKGIQKDLVLSCHSSGIIQQVGSEFLTEKIIAGYAKDDYNFITLPPGHSEWANTILKKNIAFFKKYINFSNVKSVFEIGAGSFFLARDVLEQYQIDNYIIFDPSIREQPDDSRILLHREYFLNSEQLSRKADLIFCISCLEHVPDPYLFLKEICQSLEPTSGQAYISFPDVEYQLRSGDLGALLHEHISYFTAASASALMVKAGFEIIHSESSDDTLRYIVKPATHRIEARQVDSEKILWLAGDQFSKSILFAKQDIESDLSKGEKVAIHGACNATYNFLYLTSLAECENLWIFDGDSTKKNKYMTSLNKQIYHSSDPLYLQMDKIYIGAMTFFEEIVQYLKEFHGIDEGKIIPLFPR